MKVSVPSVKSVVSLHLLAIGVTIVATASADVVITTTGERIVGDVRLDAGGWTIGPISVPWDDVLSVKTSRSGTIRPPDTIRLRNGEILCGRALALENSTLIATIEPFGRHEIDLQLVSALEFFPTAGEAANDGDGILYRRDGKPLSGTITALTPVSLQVRSPLGIFQLPRQEVQRYVFHPVDASRDDPDELRMINGGQLYGRAAAEGDRIILRHRILGRLATGLGGVASLRRSVPGTTWVATAPWQAQPADGPLGPVAQPRRLDAPINDSDQPWIDALELAAGSAVRLPAANGGRFTTWAALAPRARVSGKLRAAVDGDVVAERSLPANAANALWSFALPAGDLELRFDFDGRVGLPCNVVLGDPLIVSDKP